MFSNIEVENTVTDVQEPLDIAPRQIENVSLTGIQEQDPGILSTCTNQSNDNNRVGNGVITVSIQLLC